MRTLLITLLSLVLVVSFIGCGDKDTTEEPIPLTKKNLPTRFSLDMPSSLEGGTTAGRIACEGDCSMLGEEASYAFDEVVGMVEMMDEQREVLQEKMVIMNAAINLGNLMGKLADNNGKISLENAAFKIEWSQEMIDLLVEIWGYDSAAEVPNAETRLHRVGDSTSSPPLCMVDLMGLVDGYKYGLYYDWFGTVTGCDNLNDYPSAILWNVDSTTGESNKVQIRSKMSETFEGETFTGLSTFSFSEETEKMKFITKLDGAGMHFEQEANMQPCDDATEEDLCINLNGKYLTNQEGGAATDAETYSFNAQASNDGGYLNSEFTYREDGKKKVDQSKESFDGAGALTGLEILNFGDSKFINLCGDLSEIIWDDVLPDDFVAEGTMLDMSVFDSYEWWPSDSTSGSTEIFASLVIVKDGGSADDYGDVIGDGYAEYIPGMGYSKCLNFYGEDSQIATADVYLWNETSESFDVVDVTLAIDSNATDFCVSTIDYENMEPGEEGLGDEWTITYDDTADAYSVTDGVDNFYFEWNETEMMYIDSTFNMFFDPYWEIMEPYNAGGGAEFDQTQACSDIQSTLESVITDYTTVVDSYGDIYIFLVPTGGTVGDYDTITETYIHMLDDPGSNSSVNYQCSGYEYFNIGNPYFTGDADLYYMGAGDLEPTMAGTITLAE